MNLSSRVRVLPAAALAFLLGFSSLSYAADVKVAGRVLDPQGSPVVGAKVQLMQRSGGSLQQTTTDSQGRYQFEAHTGEDYTLRADAAGFVQATKELRLGPRPVILDIQLTGVSGRNESLTVTANVDEASLTAPDPGQRVLVRQELLDANPGRPGAPVSIPGLPIETASGGIKAPQYFVPGVAGDHGEPIAQYISVGTYLVPNNLSANAHGNGYADPNILVPQAIDSVQVDGGAFNVLEGNHALNLAASYAPRGRLDPFVTLTGDYRDADLTAGLSPTNPDVRAWAMLEAAYGNGFLDRIEHRQQYKLNGLRVFDFGSHELTLFGIAYYGSSYVPGLAPLGVNGVHDTVDPRQRDQTHTAELGANDVWKLNSKQQIAFSGFFRTYNLSLYSNFGQEAEGPQKPLSEQLIRQSEFRTVTGGNSTYINHLSEYVSLLAGVDYARDAPRRDDLDHFNQSPVFTAYGPFARITANNVTIGDLAPYVALNGELIRHLRYYLGLRRDEVAFNNQDLLNPANSFDHLAGVNNPKATLAYVPGAGSWLPMAAVSWGESFFTNDPRIGTGTTQGTLVERAHSYQLVVDKLAGHTDFRLTLGHVTTSATLAKIDPDTGLQEDEGPGRLKFLTALVRQRFSLGLLQASISKADARDVLTGEPTPEAPRTIFDALGTLDRLPWHLQARGEFEYVGQKPLGDGFVSVPVKEFRAAVVRGFRQRRLDAGLNFLIARGYTGQTTEVLALPDDAAAFERVVGVRLESYVGASVSYHFRPRTGP